MSNLLARRELLASFLGAPFLAAAGCSRSAPVLPPAGEIIGASSSLGHRLREGLKPVPTADQWQRTGVVIVGGGIAGLSAAWRLLRAGVDDFVVLELEPQPGGTSRSGTSGAFAYPWGAHYLPVPFQENRAILTLLDEMGFIEGRDDEGEPIVGEQFLSRDPQERVFFEGLWHEGLYRHENAEPHDERQWADFQAEIGRWAAWRDGRGRRAFVVPVAACSDDAEVIQFDRQTMTDWLTERGFDSPKLRWLVDYACRDDYGLTVDQTSAWAGLFYFVSRVRKPGAEAQPLMTWPEGNGRLVAHLCDKARTQVKLGLAVSEVIPAAEGQDVGVDVVAVDREGRAAASYHAGHVIFAAPHFLAPYLIAGFRDARGKAAAEFEYGSWMVANLFLKDRPVNRGFHPAWDNVLYDSPSLGYVAATHQRGPEFGPTVWTYYYPLCDDNPRTAREKLLAHGWSQWAEVTLADLERAHPDLRPLVERLDVMRWGHAMIRPRPGFIWGDARRDEARAFRGVHFAHCDLSGVALFEEAFYHGLRAAEEILTERGVPFESLVFDTG
ncbi:MAG TPA: FAD-dependent oxidoreductase [Planctomycetaceae bacterium]